MKGLRARGGYEVDIDWSNGSLSGAVITASRTQTCRILAGRQIQISEAGTRVENITVTDGIAEFPVEAGKRYTLTVKE
ncbi:hypothetical protein D3C81_2224490 [compost metagenome]